MPMKLNPNALDLTEFRSGMLTARKPVGHRHGYIMWLCDCDCGKTAIVRSSIIHRKIQVSCGCQKKLPPILRGADNPRWNGGIHIRATKAIVCPECKEERQVRVDHAEREVFTGLCSTCVLKVHGKKGEFHPNWRGGIADERSKIKATGEYERWRFDVFARDDFTCQSCGDDRGRNLIAHHILNFSEHEDLRLVEDNGITLCEHCHVDFHNAFGYTSNDDMQLDLFIGKRVMPHAGAELSERQ